MPLQSKNVYVNIFSIKKKSMFYTFVVLCHAFPSSYEDSLIEGLKMKYN